MVDTKKMVVVCLWIGKYTEKRVGHELFNLTKNPIDNKFYGNCPAGNNMPIDKFGAKTSDKTIDGVLVVYTKKNDKGDYEIIAFAPNATVYRNGQSGEGLSRTFKDNNGQEETSGYCVVSDTLYNMEDRVNKFTIQNEKGKNLFRNQRIYVDEHPNLFNQIAVYVESVLESKEMLVDDIDDQDEIQKAEPATPKEIEGSADRPLNIVSGGQGKAVGRDSRYAKAALIKAGYKCQVDPSCQTFKTKKGVPYMEGHHLIPCTLSNAEHFKKEYGKNIDCVENIVCLCPLCHRAVHFGDEDTKTACLKAMYETHADKLKAAGIPITFDELLGYYKK